MFHLPDDVKRIMDETYYQELRKPKVTLKLPCSERHKWKEPVFVEITEARDQKVACPKCGKESYLVWSKTGNHRYA